MNGRHIGRIGLLTLAASMLAGAVATAQGLADVARQEEQRRKAIAAKAAAKTPQKVYTNDNLNPDFTVPTTPPASGGSTTTGAATGTKAATGADQSKPAGDPANMGEDTGGNPNITPVDIDDKKESYWRGKANQIRAAIENARKDVLGLEQRTATLGGNASEQKVNAQLLAQARATVVSLQAEWDNFELVAKSAKIPDAWSR
jgi:hypothetical protein